MSEINSWELIIQTFQLNCEQKTSFYHKHILIVLKQDTEYQSVLKSFSSLNFEEMKLTHSGGCSFKPQINVMFPNQNEPKFPEKFFQSLWDTKYM